MRAGREERLARLYWKTKKVTELSGAARGVVFRSPTWW